MYRLTRATPTTGHTYDEGGITYALQGSLNMLDKISRLLIHFLFICSRGFVAASDLQ